MERTWAMMRGNLRDLHRSLLKSSVLILSLSLISACGGGGGEDPNASLSAQTIQTTIGELNVGSVVSIPLSTGSTSITFSQLTGHEQFIISLDSASKATGNFSAQMDGSLNATPLSREFFLAKTPLTDALEEPEDGEDLTDRFHDYLRQVEENLPPPEEARQFRSGDLREYLSAGETTTLKVLNSLSSTDSYSVITVQVKMITAHFIVYKDVEAQELTDSDIQSLIGSFEAKVDFEYATFGNISDQDQNGKLKIVFSPALNRMGGSGGIVTGFFFAGDLQSANAFPASNGGEIIYCHVPDESGRFGVPVPKSFYLSNTGPLCFPHELQHAINYNMKVFAHQSSAEPSAFNEGQSHFAEDIYNDFSKVGPENPSRVSIYFNSKMPSLMSGISLSHRGGAYLFYRYLYEQANSGRFPNVKSGGELMLRIHDTNKTGFDSIEEVTGEGLSSILSDFFSTLPLSSTGLSKDPRYNFSGINLRAAQGDNRNTILSGPPVTESNLPTTLSIPSLSSQYTLIKGSALQASGNTLNIRMDLSGVPVASLVRIGDL